ncbi:MAG: SDR family NAD(P)-dependent oxidoreductase [Polyangiales bacterium]
MRLPKEPRVVVTGAGSGFGRALCLEVARRGARILASDVNVANAEETCRLAKEAGAHDARALRCDVTQAEQVEALAAAADEAWGGTDLVANNAGVGSGGRVGEVSLEDWKWTIDVDLWGVIYGCHAFVPRMRKQKSGHVLNVASAAGLLCAPKMAPYNVAKAGVIALSETMSAELIDDGVGVTVLCPTFFKTNIVASGRFTDAASKKMGEAMIARSNIEPGAVAKSTLAAIERGDLYTVPMADGRWMWRLKRLSPDAFRKLAGRVAEKMAPR